ncbi:hypothetical protein ACH4TY_26145 [Streptomyces anulatus]
MVEDLRHAFDLAAELGVESPLGRAAGAAATDGHTAAVADGGGCAPPVRVAAAVDGGPAASGPR